MYDAQVKRMLADPRSESLVTNFAFQWLGVRRLDALDPDPRLYPTFDEDLRSAFVTEMRLFLDSVLRDDKASVLDLFSADYTFANERLARHYGIPSVRGAQFRRVHLDDERRWGLFGKGSVLMVSSYPDRTSPVLRGRVDHGPDRRRAAAAAAARASRRTFRSSIPAWRCRFATGSLGTARNRRATSATA